MNVFELLDEHYKMQQGGTWEKQKANVQKEKYQGNNLLEMLQEDKDLIERLSKKDRIKKETNTKTSDNTKVNTKNKPELTSKSARNKTDKEIAEERKSKIDESVKYQDVPFTKDNWREVLAKETQATGDKFRFSNEPNTFDDYLNPAVWIGDMASNLGQAPLRSQQEDSFMPYVTAVGTPLAVGAMAGLGTQNTGQFVNNLANPLAGTGNLLKGLGSKASKQLPEIADEIIFDMNATSSVNLQRSKTPRAISKKPQFTEENIGNGLIEKTPNRGQKDIVKKVTLEGDSSQFAELKKITENGEDLYYFSASIPSSQLKAGRALKHLEQYIPKGATIVEKNSLSLDSFENIMKKANKSSEFQWSEHGFVPLNNASKRNLFTNSTSIVPNSVNVKFTKLDEAKKALQEFNSKFNMEGLSKAKVSEHFDSELGKKVYGIEVPNIGLKKLYKEGGVVEIPNYQNGGEYSENEKKFLDELARLKLI